MELNKNEISTIEKALVIYEVMIKNRLKEVRKNNDFYSSDYLLFLENEKLITKDLLKIIQ